MPKENETPPPSSRQNSSPSESSLPSTPQDNTTTTTTITTTINKTDNDSKKWFQLILQFNKPPQNSLNKIFQQTNQLELYQLFQKVIENESSFLSFWNLNSKTNLELELTFRLRSILYDSYVTNHVLFNNSINLNEYLKINEFHTLENDYELINLQNSLQKNNLQNNNNFINNNKLIDIYKVNQLDQYLFLNNYLPNLLTMNQKHKEQNESQKEEEQLNNEIKINEIPTINNPTSLSQLSSLMTTADNTNHSTTDDNTNNELNKNKKIKSVLSRELKSLKNEKKKPWKDSENLQLIYLYNHLSQTYEKILENENSWPFKKPVKKSEAKDYYEIIKNPIDLTKINKKIEMMSYHSKYEFFDDLKLMFDNCRFFNNDPNENVFVECANKLEKECIILLEKIPNVYVELESDCCNVTSDKTTDMIKKEYLNNNNIINKINKEDLEWYKSIKEELIEDIISNIGTIDIFNREERWNEITKYKRLINLKIRQIEQDKKFLERNCINSFEENNLLTNFIENLMENNQNLNNNNTMESTSNITTICGVNNNSIIIPDYGLKISPYDITKNVTKMKNVAFQFGIQDENLMKQSIERMMKFNNNNTEIDLFTFLLQTGYKSLNNNINNNNNTQQQLNNIENDYLSPVPFHFSKNLLLKQNVDKICQLREKRKHIQQKKFMKLKLTQSPVKSPSTQSFSNIFNNKTINNKDNNSSIKGSIKENIISKENINQMLSSVIALILMNEGFEGVKSQSLNILTDVLDIYLTKFTKLLNTSLLFKHHLNTNNCTSLEDHLFHCCEEMIHKNISVKDLKEMKMTIERKEVVMKEKLERIENKLNWKANQKPTIASTLPAPKTKLLPSGPNTTILLSSNNNNNSNSNSSGSSNNNTITSPTTSSSRFTTNIIIGGNSSGSSGIGGLNVGANSGLISGGNNASQENVQSKDEDEEDISELISPSALIGISGSCLDLTVEEDEDASGKKRKRELFEDDISVDDIPFDEE
ncbi:hypothetical protein ABK040_014326 [Willaertia magna]